MANDNFLIIRSIILSQFIQWSPTYDLHTAAIVECRWQIRRHFHSQNLNSLSLQAMCMHKFFCHQDGSSRAVRCGAALELRQRTIDARWVQDLLHSVIFLKLWIATKNTHVNTCGSLLFNVQHVASAHVHSQVGQPSTRYAHHWHHYLQIEIQVTVLESGKIKIPCYKTFNVLKPDTSMGATSTLSGDLKSLLTADKGHAVAQLVEALRYKLKGSGFDSWWSHWNFSLT